MNRIVYPVIFTSTGDERGTYLVEIPDINGFTEGIGLSDAIIMARDYIGESLYDKAADDIPEPSDIRDIDISKAEFASEGESMISLVDIDLEAFKKKMETKAVRKNVSLPAALAQEAEKAHLNLSRVLQEALAERLGWA